METISRSKDVLSFNVCIVNGQNGAENQWKLALGHGEPTSWMVLDALQLRMVSFVSLVSLVGLERHVLLLRVTTPRPRRFRCFFHERCSFATICRFVCEMTMTCSPSHYHLEPVKYNILPLNLILKISEIKALLRFSPPNFLLVDSGSPTVDQRLSLR